MPKIFLKKFIRRNKIYKLCYIILIQEILITLLIFNIINKNIKIYEKKKKLLKVFKNDTVNDSYLYEKIKEDYDNNYFVIIICKRCKYCGLFALLKYYLHDINDFINNGYIPIIDLSSYPNVFNGFNKTSLNDNPFELFFNQPFGYTLINVIEKATKIKYFNCTFPHHMLNHKTIYFHNYIFKFWQNILFKYIPIKNEIINQSYLIKNDLFKNSENILGILIRGTDYLARKPKFHPIQPKVKIVINDIKEFNEKNKYDFFFIGTEDINIRNQFINEFGEKLKYIKSKNNIEYNYKKKNFLALNKNMKGNIDNIKIYLLNIIILSKCIDIICSRTNGTIGLLILSMGFRNYKIYFLGEYK